MKPLGWLKVSRQLAMSVMAAALMAAAGAGAVSLKPAIEGPSASGKLDLSGAIPSQIGQWKIDLNGVVALPDPQVQRLSDQIYSQLIARTYVNASTGDRIMLSIAYGEEQRDTRQIHLPEVCYPAQGFQIVSQAKGLLQTDLGTIEARRLVATRSERTEPITYWITVGNKVVMGDLRTKIEQIRHRYRGEVADGVIFRVSSISPDSEHAFQVQTTFVQEFVRVVPSIHLSRLTGIQSSQHALSRAED